MDGSYEFPSSATSLLRYVDYGRWEGKDRNFHSPQQLDFAFPVVTFCLYKMKCSCTVAVSGNFWLLPAPLVWTRANSLSQKKKINPTKKTPAKQSWAGCTLSLCRWQPENLSPFGGASAAAQLLPGCLQGWSSGICAEEGGNPGLG